MNYDNTEVKKVNDGILMKGNDMQRNVSYSHSIITENEIVEWNFRWCCFIREFETSADGKLLQKNKRKLGGVV